jgi:hypothetical protein
LLNSTSLGCSLTSLQIAHGGPPTGLWNGNRPTGKAAPTKADGLTDEKKKKHIISGLEVIFFFQPQRLHPAKFVTAFCDSWGLWE